MKKTSLIYCRGFPDGAHIHNNILINEFISYYPRFLEILNYDTKTNFNYDMKKLTKKYKYSLDYLKNMHKNAINLLNNKYKSTYLYIPIKYKVHNNLLQNSFICHKCYYEYYKKLLILLYLNKFNFNLPSDIIEPIIFISLDNYIANTFLNIVNKNNIDNLINELKSMNNPIYYFLNSFIIFINRIF